MDGFTSADILLFEGFRLDRRGGGLFRLQQSGCPIPVPLGSRTLDLLALLAGRAEHVVLKDAIMKAVWPGKVVEDANLNVQISKLRRVLDRTRQQGSCIQTITGYGYRFVAPVIRIDPAADSPSEQHDRDGWDRLGRSTRDGLFTLAAITHRKDGTLCAGDMTTPQGRLMLTVLRGLEQFERDVRLRATKDGAAAESCRP